MCFLIVEDRVARRPEAGRGHDRTLHSILPRSFGRGRPPLTTTQKSAPQPLVALVSDAATTGGAELYLELLVRSLATDFRFHALLSDQAPDHLVARLGNAGATVERVSGLGRRPSPLAVKRLRRRLRALNPDIVHVNLSDQGDGLGPLLAGALTRDRLVATLHLVIPGRTHLKEFVSSRLLALPDVLICVSHSVSGYARASARRVAVVHCAVPEPQFEDEPRAWLGLKREAFVIGGIGRLHHQKGWDVLCQAAGRILEELPEATIAIMGEGPERVRLARSTRTRLRFLGHQHDASRMVRAFDILVVPSRYEAFGLVALEAMHAGVPVVASRVGGLPEALGPCGTFVAPERPDDLAQAIIALARDPSIRAEHARCGLERARTMFSVERMAAATGAVYAERLHSLPHRNPSVHS